LRRLISAALLLLLLFGASPLILGTHAQSQPQAFVRSQYTLDRYGFATANETVQFQNNGTSTQAPGLTFGFGNLSSMIVAYNFTGAGFSLSASGPDGPFTVTGTVQPGNASSYVLSVLLNGVVTTASNGSLRVLTLTSPSLSPGVSKLLEVVQMPTSTTFVSSPPGLKASPIGTNDNYTATLTNTGPVSAQTSVEFVKASPAEDFNPLLVYSATRTISVSTSGVPLVTDTLDFENLGTVALTSLHVNPLTTPSASITILFQSQPPLLHPFSVPLSSDAIPISAVTVGYPSGGIPPGVNYSISYQYTLAQSYYSVSGSQVAMNIPGKGPLPAFVGSYSIAMDVPPGAGVVQGAPQPLTGVSPWHRGEVKLSYALTAGWGVDVGVPTASVIFVVLLFGLFVSRSTATLEEETDEESSTETASAMIKAFDEKTHLINGLWTEVAGMDPNELDKAYFDELRGRLDTFRSKALQRLNEVRQKSTTQRFSDLLNQIQATEREADRAAKDKLNLYEQFYMRRMRKEVFDRLLPQYTKRLEKALNELSDELHVVQRESKLL
jgi:hypothetical protein